MDYPMTVAQQMLRYITPDKSVLYVFSPFGGIGDFLLCGGLSHALLKKKRKQSCILIEREKFINCNLNFVGVTEVRYPPQILLDIIRHYVYATREYETDNYIYGSFHMRQNFEDWNTGVIRTSHLSFVDSFKNDIFGLPLNTELIPPIIDPPTDYQKQRLHDNYILDKKRTIILVPYANTTTNLEESFWVKLVDKLTKKNKDYIFYTNVAAPHEKIIPGTAPIITTFPELLYIAEKVNCFIGHRSGIFDLLALTNAKLLYINRDIENWWFFDLDLNYNHTNSKAFYLASAPEQA